MRCPVQWTPAVVAIILAWPGVVYSGQADPLPDYAVISILGDSFSVARKGDDVRRGGRQPFLVPLDDPALDRAALLATKKALEAAARDARVVMTLVREPAVYAAQADVLKITTQTQALLAALQPIVKGVKAKKLILLSKIRHE